MKWLMLGVVEIAVFVVFAAVSESTAWRTFSALCAAGGGIGVGMMLAVLHVFGEWP